MQQPKIGLQLIIYGKQPEDDLAGVAQEIAQAGYAGIECGAGVVDTAGAEGVNRVLARTGLQLSAAHASWGEIIQPARLDQYLQFVKAVGAKYFISSGVAPQEGIAAYETAAETFNQIGEYCQQEGITFCYHNHASEFEEFDGVKGMHRLCELTDPALVKLNIDVYWVAIGGEDPAEFIHRYADRAGYYHFKDGAPGLFTELGQGTVDLVAAKEAAMAAGNAEWIVVEQDRTEKEPRVSSAESREYLRAIGW